MAKYLVLFSLTSETAKRFIAKPSDRAAVVREVAESAGGSLESYYWMFGQYDGAAVFDLPDSRTMAAVSLAITSSGALSRFEAHELFESSDLTAIAGRAQGSPTGRPVPGRRGGLPPAGTGEGCFVMADTATVSAIQARQHACNSLTKRHVRWADSAALGDYIR